MREAHQPTREERHMGEEEPPPIGGSWLVLYAIVLLNLAALVFLFFIFTRAFS
jgi:hypothetical protein